MKRLPAPAIRRREVIDAETEDFIIIREDLPPHWLLGELLFHTINLCADVHERISARMLLDAVSSMRDFESGKDTFFNRTYALAYAKNGNLLAEFQKNNAEGYSAEEYLERRNAAVPQYQTHIDMITFIFREYRYLPDKLRAVTDLAFSGFLFNALNGPDFAALCKNKSLNTSTMTFEQKLDEALDHEALYERLLAQLGPA